MCGAVCIGGMSDTGPARCSTTGQSRYVLTIDQCGLVDLGIGSDSERMILTSMIENGAEHGAAV